MGPHFYESNAKPAVHLGLKLIKSPVLMKAKIKKKNKELSSFDDFIKLEIGSAELIGVKGCNWSIWILVNFGAWTVNC